MYGIFITRSSLPNHSNYRYGANFRYTLQRATGIIAFLFIFWHVFHMHGWIHSKDWLDAIRGWGGNFQAFNATSTAAAAMQASILVPILYTIGVYYIFRGKTRVEPEGY